MDANALQASFVDRLDNHRGILFKVANAYCAKPADREELIQETIAQLWRSYERFDGRSSFATWMYRIAVNVAISYYRSETRKRRRLVPVGESVLERLPAPNGAQTDDRLDLLRELIGQLPPLDRALMLLYLDDRPYSEIASILGISETNAGTKIARIKDRLKRSASTASH